MGDCLRRQMDGWVVRSGVGWVDVCVGGQTDGSKRQVDVYNGRVVAKVETDIKVFRSEQMDVLTETQKTGVRGEMSG